MTELTEYAVEDVMTLVRRPIRPAVGETYREIGLRSFGKGIFHKDPVTAEAIAEKRVFKVQPGDLIFSNIFAWEGAVAIASEREKGMIGSHRFMTHEVNAEVADARYLLHYFHGGPGLNVIRSASPGSAGRNRTLGTRAFAAKRVLLPSLSEQRRISEKLDAALEKCLTVSTLRSHTSSLLVSLQESMVHEALQRSTETVRMGDIVTLTRTEIDVCPEKTYRPIGMRGFGRGVIRYEPTPGSRLGKLRFYKFPNSALVLSNIKAWEGAIGVTSGNEEEFIASNRFLFYTPKREGVNISYLRHYLLSRKGLNQISACSPGAADRNRTLGVKRFENIRFDLPPRDTQDRVTSTLDGLNKRLSAAHSAPTLQALPPALLDAAFSGRL
ncbi:restriction endonuclease subunit S [Streptomyces sp. NPDC049916]|uniref:restriction endonuclease subunit S n=1 Tax=Streptomyces sp. NPDC049916 TaxID=3155156 RepID=UPI0034234717